VNDARTSKTMTILDLLRDMGSRDGRNYYDIGHYWNAVDQAAAEIERLRAQNAELKSVIRGKTFVTAPEWTEETAWLVERGDNGPPRYRTMSQGLILWTDDISKALRFARRKDAEMFAEEDEDAWRIAEHMWTGLKPRVHRSADETTALPTWDQERYDTGTIEGMRRYIFEQLGFLTTDDNRPAEAILRLARKRLTDTSS
jgi:hypothetical protein